MTEKIISNDSNGEKFTIDANGISFDNTSPKEKLEINKGSFIKVENDEGKFIELIVTSEGILEAKSNLEYSKGAKLFIDEIIKYAKENNLFNR